MTKTSTPRKDAVRKVRERADKVGKRYKIVHREAFFGWCQAVAVEATTGRVIFDENGEAITIRYRPHF